MSTLSRLACDWAIRAFGPDHVNDRKVRSLRIVEEAIELCQAYGVDKEKVALAVNEVYGRPPGEPTQELGGVLLTTYIMCASRGNEEPDDVMEVELARVLAKPVEHFAARNQAKLNAGLS